MSSNINNIIDSSENKLSKWKDDLKEIKNGIKDEINDTLSSIEHITGAASERSPLLNKMKRGKDNNTNDNTNNNNEGRSNSSPSKLSYTPNEEEEAEDTAAAAAAVVVTDDEEHTTATTPTSTNTAATKSNSKQKVVPNNSSNSSQGGITQLILITLLSISTIYQTILHKLDIVSNSIPFIVALHWCTLTFLIGMSSNSSSSLSSWRDGGVTGMMSEEDVEGGSSLLDDQHTQQERHVTFSVRQPSEQQQAGLQKQSSTKELIRRIPMGRRHYAKMKEQLFPQLERRDSPLEEFFTNLKPAFKNITPRFGSGGSGLDGSSGGEVTPLSEGMMLRLLKYSPDFNRRKSQMGEIDNSMLASCRRVQEGEEGNSESEEEEEVNYEMGTAPLGNIRASKLERDFGEVVVPMCKFRGMDFFVGDFPEKEIWKQPLLLKNGLRDTPTLVGNLMLPHGNLTTYLQLPDWFDDWDNIPDEKDDDPQDVKAFKRFFKGDSEYQRRRAKIIPCVVKAPYVVKMISPNPCEMTMHSERHPVSIKKVNKVVDPVTGKTTAAALMEAGVDFYSSNAIGRLINIVMPHLDKITIDVAMVIAPPWGAEGEEANEPSACLGVWRIDKVDFTGCAQLPEKPTEEVLEEVKEVMKSFTPEERSIWEEVQVAA